MLQTVITRLLSLATVLTLVLFAASAGLQPDTALAQPGCGPSGGQPPKCEDTTNGGDHNGGDNGGDHNDGDHQNRNGDNDNDDDEDNDEDDDDDEDDDPSPAVIREPDE